MNAPVGGVRATWLLTRLLLIRTKNLLLSGFAKAKPAARSGTPSKPGTSWALLAVCVALWVPGLVSAMSDVVDNLRRGAATRPAVGTERVLEEGFDPISFLTDPEARWRALHEFGQEGGRIVRKRVRIANEPGGTEAAPMRTALAFLVLGALVIALHGLLMAPDMWRPEWSFEWLFTLPLSVPALLTVRTIAGMASNLGGYFMLGPILGVVAWDAGWGYASPLVAVLLTAPLLAVLSLTRQAFEISLRLSLDPARLRNVQALTTAGGFALWLPVMFLLSPAAGEPDHWAYEWLRALPLWLRYTPPGLTVMALTATAPAAIAAYSAALVVEVVALMAVAFSFLNRRLARGLLAGGARESARARTALPPVGPRRWLTPFQGKTLALIFRDRNLLVTAFGLPLFMILQQVVMVGNASFVNTPARAAAAGFGVGALALMMSVPHVVLKEAETFWFLKTFPRKIEELLLENALMWGALLSLYPVIALLLAVRTVDASAVSWAVHGALVLAGMAAYTVVATGLSLLSSNPTATDTRQQLSPWGMWLFMVLVGVYLQALVSGDPWRILGGLMLALMMAYAFWQKIGDHLPYMLDPAAAPPPRISLADGLIAAEVFFLLQAVALAGSNETALTLRALLPGFTIAGGITCTLLVLTVWQLGMTGMPRLFGGGSVRALGESLCGGALAGALGLAWIKANLVAAPVEPPIAADEVQLLAALGVFVAPFFEEVIFRGLVYTGMRRSLSAPRAIFAASLLFAILHPLHAFVPVFLMALIGTTLFERSGLLASSLIVHALYNACVLFIKP